MNITILKDFSINGDNIGTNLCDAIVNWIQTSLDPYEVMWVNYMKNNVCVFECRTTSIAESMHS